MPFIHRYFSPLGPILLAGEDDALTGLWFEGQRHFAPPPGALPGSPDAVLRAAAWLDAYFAGRVPDVDVPLRPAGTPFQRAVRALLREIPYGRTAAYGELAERLSRESGRRVSARAVGGAVGRNPVALIVPCHRVVGADGSLTGYAGGLDRKRALLALEGALLPDGQLKRNGLPGP